MEQNWAITIGINGYRNLQQLNYAKRDAEAMQSFLQQELNIETVYHFTDDSPVIYPDYGPALDSYPTYATLRRFFRIRFEDSFLRPGDNLWFFFAGHGKHYEGRDYLLPIDADPGDEIEKSTWIPLSYITERLRRSGADNVVMLIDACRTEGIRDGEGIGWEKQKGVITLFACSPGKPSYEIDELQHGAFTYALLQGLKVEGEGNCATVERLYHRLLQTVPQVTQQYKRVQQTPHGVIEPPTKYHLILLPGKANSADIDTLKMDAQRAELKKDFKLAKQLWIRVLATRAADHDAIEGIERLALVSATPTTLASDPPSLPALPTFPTIQFEVITVDAQGRDVNRCPGEAQYLIERLGDGVLLEMVFIPGGSFQMGSSNGEGDDDEQPQHAVTVQPFLMGKYAVTQAQWQTVAGLPKIYDDLKPEPSRFTGDNRPVEQVSWHDAVEFCARLSKQTGHDYRLPSEAEWEYACRAGTTTPFHLGETITTDWVNYDGQYAYAAALKGEYREQTTEVGRFLPNAFGLYDMHGNVWEWCLDHWHDHYRGAPTNGSAWIAGGDSNLRLLRGGSWNSLPGDCRSAYRSWDLPASRDDLIGFRVVCGSPWIL